jgi:hypothetical protein
MKPKRIINSSPVEIDTSSNTIHPPCTLENGVDIRKVTAIKLVDIMRHLDSNDILGWIISRDSPLLIPG